jgi:hypothetical protein
MRTAMRPRYYCDHCNKGSGSPSAMRRHERGCTANPQRVCGMCTKMFDEYGLHPAPQRDDLVQVMDAQGFKAMCEAANNCPACILAAVRTKNFAGDAETPPGVLGPEDGRESWSYKQAKADWWAEWNSAQAEREHPY